MRISKRGSASGSGKSGVGAFSGLARCTKATKSVGGFCSSTIMFSPSEAITQVSSRLARNVTSSSGRESFEKSGTAFILPIFSPSLKSAAVTLLALTDFWLRILLSPEASLEALVPSDSASSRPPSPKTTSSPHWRPSGSLMVKLSSGVKVTTIVPIAGT